MRLLSIILLFTLLWGCHDTDAPQARDGVLDLRDWQPGGDGPVELGGEWALWWGVLLEPGEQPEPERIVTVPGSWNALEGAEGPVGPVGAATYRLKVLLPEQAGGLSLRMAGAATAHRLFIDGQERIGGGVVSTDPDQIVPAGTRWIHGIPAARSELELLVQVANAEYRSGGLRRAPLLGATDQILVTFQRKLLVDGTVLAVMVAVGLYQLGLFLLRPTLRVHLPFGLMCVIFGLRSTLSREGQIADMLLPGLSWVTMIRLEHLLSWLSLTVGLWWVGWMFPRRRRSGWRGFWAAARCSGCCSSR
ncbi:MAG: hypothetical protein ACI8S6_001166 [Myxococcota bacterium]|jgi:hypothetical protein